SPLAVGSTFVATVAAMRNLAGRRFSATSKYQDKAPRMAGSSQTFSLLKLLMRPAPATWRWPVNRNRLQQPQKASFKVQSSTLPAPIFAHVALSQNLAGLLRKARVGARPRPVAEFRRLRRMPMRALGGRLLPSGQSGRPPFMR